MNWLGLDIGGANLKAADGLGWARSAPYSLWRDPAGLANALRPLIQDAPFADRFAVTMTGELCDCFRTKDEGVRSILNSVNEIADGRRMSVYLVDGRFVSIDDAIRKPKLAAASNWHALASFACRFVEGERGLLIDIGSTTTDIIPLINGSPQVRGLTDTERLCAGELVYTGVGRTPICAATSTLPWRGTLCPVAAELFATVADAYTLLGDIPEQADAASTADGRPLTIEFARDRLGRMICADEAEFDLSDAHIAAAHVRDRQSAQILEAITQTAGAKLKSPTTIIVSGAGEFLARRVANQAFSGVQLVSLTEQLGAVVSSCGPAHAMAALARDEKRHA